MKNLFSFLFIVLVAGCSDNPDDASEATEGRDEVAFIEINGIRRPEGFRVEKLLDIDPHQFGSWVSLAFDKRGNLLAGAERGPLHRVTLADGRVTKVEAVKGVPGHVHGILEAFDSLYVVSHQRGALVRCRDVNGDGVYDQEEAILPLQGEGEHGPHGIILTEDGAGIYLIAGNQCPTPLEAEFPALPSPGGWIARLPPDASKIHLVSSGLRNAYDLALNAHGDLFTCDSDAEQDAGLPWYRAPRFLHVASGADFGWREGSKKWPGHYADSLLPVTELGPSSPAGLVSGHLTHFPKRYRNAIFVLDWTFGAIHTIRLTPDGASYSGAPEMFLSGKGLPVADAAVAPDGSLYFVTGGRAIPTKLYRIRHERPAPVSRQSPAGNRLRDNRLKLEALHRTRPSESALQVVWLHLGNPDRYVRHAARVALERQSVDGWRELFERETGTRASINASLALARKAPVHRRAALAKLSGLSFGSLLPENKLAYLRAFSIAVEIKPEPPPELLALIVPQLDVAYPSESDALNMELSRALRHLKVSDFVGKTLALLQARRSAGSHVDRSLLSHNPRYGDHFLRLAERPPDPLGLHLAFMAKDVGAERWRPGQLMRFARWLREANGMAPTGTRYHDVVNLLAQKVEDALPPTVKAELGPRPDSPPPIRILPKGPGHDWTLLAVLAATENLRGRNFDNGSRTFVSASCSDCHRFAGTGKAFGPTLDGVGKRFSRTDLLEAIIHPSKAIPETYATVSFSMKSGAVFAGRLLSRDPQGIFLAEDPFDPEKVTRLEAVAIEQETPSLVSPMPPALLNSLNEEELKDLVAYLLSDGNPKDPRFR